MRRSSLLHLHAVGSAHRAQLGRAPVDDGQRESFWDLPGSAGEFDLDLECGTTIGLDDPEASATKFDPATQVLVAYEPPAEIAQGVDREREIEDAAWDISAQPFFSIFQAARVKEGEAQLGIPSDAAGHPSPPPSAAPGGRSLPSLCLTPRLLAQRPQAARAHRAGW